MRAPSKREPLKVACPRCGTECSLRIDRLDRTHYCRGCNAGIYIDHKGSCVLDRRKLDRRGGRFQFANRLASTAPARLLRRLFALLTARWQALSQRSRIILTVAMAVALPLGLASWATVAWTQFSDTDDQADSLNVRARVVGQALFYDDVELLSGITAHGTYEDLEKWFRVARPPSWGQNPDDRPLQISSRVMFKDPAGGKAGLSVRIVPPANDAVSDDGSVSGSQSVEPLQVVVFWVLGRDGRWLMDGSKTYQEHLTLRDTD